MRKTMAILMASTMIVALALTTPAEAQTAPVEGTTAAFGYDLLFGSGTPGPIQGFAFHVDRPVWSFVTMAGGGSFVSGGGMMQNSTIDVHRMYAGVGPGVRYPVGEDRRTEVFGHMLLGFLHQNIGLETVRERIEASENKFNAAFGAGLDYRATESFRVRVALEYDGEAHLIGGLAFQF